MPADAPADLGERQSAAQKLLERSPVHTRGAVNLFGHDTNTCSHLGRTSGGRIALGLLLASLRPDERERVGVVEFAL
jgi:hypothetical protein